ncbi:MAG: DUF4251 domain-containing protein [Ilyomonas sp.]
MKKTFSVLKYLLLLFIIAVFTLPSVSAQTDSSSSIKNALQSKNFVFVARTVTPMRGGLKQLTSYYDVKVSNDSLISYLPYFGRAYTAPLDPSKAGLHFTSTNFSYDINERRKGGWNIMIKPNDNTDVRELTLTVFKNGNASLQVLSNNREAISFNGTIKAVNQNK